MQLSIIRKINLFFIRKKWRKLNTHNHTIIGQLHLQDKRTLGQIKVGNFTYGIINALFFNKEEKLTIGNFVSIANNVTFNIGGDHVMSTITTYPIDTMITKTGKYHDTEKKGGITIGDGVWIGNNTSLLGGINVSAGAVIATGSVVVKDVPPYAIVGGIPAKIIKYRFSQDIIDELVKIRWEKIDEKTIHEKLDDFYKDCENNREFIEFLKQYTNE